MDKMDEVAMFLGYTMMCIAGISCTALILALSLNWWCERMNLMGAFFKFLRERDKE